MSKLIHTMFSWDDNSGGPWGKPTKKPTDSRGQRKSDQPRQPQQNPAPEMEAEELLREAEARLRQLFGGGNGGGGRRGKKGGSFDAKWLGYGALAVAGLWLVSGFYIVAPDERGVVLRFGQYVQTTQPGLNYRLPSPIEQVIKPKVTRENIVEIGFRSFSGNNGNAVLQRLGAQRGAESLADVQDESLMLTGDENIVDLDFTVRWRIAEPRDFLFNVVDVPLTIKNVAESAMREVIGSHPIDDALTASRDRIQEAALLKIQQILNDYGAGVQVTGVELQQVNPPSSVVDAFRDVQAARADAERAENEAQAYANDILPRARGEAAQVMQNAEAYKQSQVAQAEGDAQRFLAQLTEYQKAPVVTRERLYLETMSEVLGNTRTLYLSGEHGQSVLPYLPLDGQRPARTAR